MFTSFKVQLNAYKWIIITVLFSALMVFAVWQYHKSTVLEIKYEEQSTELKTVSTSFDNYKKNTDKALADIALFREAQLKINEATAELENRVDGLKTISTKPTPDGANSSEIQNQANALSKDVFKRIEDSSKGKIK